MTQAPQDSRDRFARGAELFAALRGRSAEERRAALAEVGQQDPALASEVEALLDHDEGGTMVLDRPVVGVPVGARIGRYRILGVIGEGGMGMVFHAEQDEPVRRAVALKVIKLGMDTRAVVRRFEAERKALARMEHPGIAQIYDGGVAPDGRPYFAMELVRGVPITEWCTARHAPRRERLRLFLQVCAAVQHAHRKGVLHRDLKPTNILVMELDGIPAPKVIDFGIAKALDDDGAAATRPGGGVAPGTPEYMSPEQSGRVAGDGNDIRSDVYSLGVVLHEILTGTTPSRARTRSGAAGSAPRPSRLDPTLRGDLEAIIQRAIAEEPDRRYATVAALAEDIERHLRGEAVVARSANAAYHAWIFVKRHRVGLGVASLVACSLVAGLALALWGLHRAREELFASTVERARLAGIVGDFTVARESLWACHLERPDSPAAAWALRELFFRYPLERSVAVEGLRAAQVLVLDEGRVLVARGGRAPVIVGVDRQGTVESLAPAPDMEADGRATGASLSDDGRLVAVACHDGRVHVWRLADGSYRGVVARHGRGRASAAFLPGSHDVVTGGEDGRVLRVDADRGTTLHEIARASAAVQEVTVHAASGALAAGLHSGGVLVWSDLRSEPRMLTGHASPITALRFSPDGARLASGATDRVTMIWSVGDGALLGRYPSNNGTVRDLAWTPDGGLMVLGWWRLDLLDPATRATTPLTAEGGWRFAVPRPGRLVVTDTDSDSLRCWRTDQRELFPGVPMEAGWGLVTAREGPAPILARRESSLRGQDLDGTVAWTRDFAAEVVAVAASADGRVVAVGTRDGALWRGETDTGAWRLLASDYLPGTVRTVAVSRTGERVAYRSKGDSVAIAWLEAGGPVRREILGSSAREQLALRFDPEDRRVAATEREQGLRIADLATGGTSRLDCGQTCFGVEFTRDGAILGGGWSGGLVRLHPRRGLEGVLRGHSAVLGTLAVHPRDPALVLTGSMDGTVRLWHLGEEREMQSLAPLDGVPIRFVGFTQDGERVVVADADGRAVTWPLYRGDEFIRDNFPTPSAASRDPRR